MREIEEKRTRFSKTFDLGDGRRRLEVGKLPMHFERGGNLLDIDLTPEFDSGRKHHALRNCPYSLRVADDRPAYFYNSPSGKSVEVELIAASGKPLVEGGLFKWGEVGRDTDYVIQPLPAGCATLLILHGPDAPRTWSWAIRGDMGMIVPLVGRDSAGRVLELVETRDARSGTISVEWTGRTLDRSALRRKKQAVWADEVAWPVLIDPTVNESIAAGGDDVLSFWYSDGASFATFTAVNALLSAGRDDDSYRYYAGVRFQSIAIPQGATIDAATLTVNVVLVTGTADINIFGNDIDDAAAFSDPGNRVKNIAKTAAVTNRADWIGGEDNSVSVASIVQEIVSRVGWASNNDLAFGFFNNAGVGPGRLRIAALEHATLTEARLSIDYSAAATIVTAAGSAAGASTPIAAAQALTAAAANAAGLGAATAQAAAVASAAASSAGEGQAFAASVSTDEAPADGAASGQATVLGVAVALVAAAGLASGSGDASAAADSPGAVAPDYTPAGGGGGFGPSHRQDKQRFRTRKDKSHPKVITVRIGDWPEDPQIILGREEDAARESFYRHLAKQQPPEISSEIDEEEQILRAILEMAA